MQLVDFRRSLGLSQEDVARALGLTSKGHISDIEKGRRFASPHLALKVEKWSGGKVRAADICPALGEIARTPRAKRAAA